MGKLLKKLGIGFGCLAALALAKPAYADVIAFKTHPDGTKYVRYEIDSTSWDAVADVHGLKNTKQNMIKIDEKVRETEKFMNSKDDTYFDYDADGNWVNHSGTNVDDLTDFSKYVILNIPYGWTEEDKKALEGNLEGKIVEDTKKDDTSLDGITDVNIKLPKKTANLVKTTYGDTLSQGKEIYVSSEKDKSSLKLNLFGNKNIDLAGICLDYDIALSRHNDPVKFVIGTGAFYNDQILKENQFEEIISENQYPFGSDIVYDDIKTKETAGSGLIGKLGIKYKKLGLYLNGLFGPSKKQKRITRNAVQYDVNGNILNAGSDPTEIKESNGTYSDFYPSLDFNIYKGVSLGVGLKGEDKIFNVGIDL